MTISKESLVNLMDKKAKRIEFNRFDAIIGLTLLIPLIFYFFVFYPAIFSFDSYNQLSQIIEMKFTLGHPFIHTFIELICMKIWNSPASISLFQILVFDFTWIIICKYNRKKNTKSEKVLQLVLTFLMGLHPLIGTYTITLWKDILYSIIILQISFVIEIFIDNRFKVNNYVLIIFSLLLILVKNIRYNGLIITLGVAVIFTIILFFKDKKSKAYVKFILYLVIFHFLFMIPQNIFNVEKSTSLVNSGMFNGKAIQAFGAFTADNIMLDSEKKELNGYLNVEQLKNKYNPYFMDPILYIEKNDEKIFKDELDFYKLLLKLSLNHPKESFDFWTKSTAIIWRLEKTNDEIGTSIYTSTYAENKIDYYNHINEKTQIYKFTTRVLYGLQNIPILNIIFYRPALYFYMSIILIIFLLKIKSNILILIPNLLNLFGLIISIPIQDVRYVYANYLLFFLILVIFIDKFKIKDNEQNC